MGAAICEVNFFLDFSIPILGSLDQKSLLFPRNISHSVLTSYMKAPLAGLVKFVHDHLSSVSAAAPAAVPLGKVIHATVFALVKHHSPQVPKSFRNTIIIGLQVTSNQI